MKKIVCLLLSIIISFSLVACGNANSATTAVDNVIGMIDELEVSLTSNKAISAAEQAYAALSADQKSAVTNYESLVEARASYDRILNSFTLIEQIGPVTKNSEAAIIAAEEAYNALSIDERITITNISVLTTARTAFDAIPAKVTLTLENVDDYFTVENSYSTIDEHHYGNYYTKIYGSVLVKQSASLVGMENVTLSIRVNYSIGTPPDSSLNAEGPYSYKTYNYDVVVPVSATSGSGSASYGKLGTYITPHGYHSVDLSSIEVIAVTGSVTVN